MSCSKYNSIRQTLLRACLLTWCVLLCDSTGVAAQEPQSIWSAQTLQATVGTSAGDCFFRKKFTLVRPEEAELELNLGGDIELFINEKLVHRSIANYNPFTLNVLTHLNPGVNLIAVKARHASSLPVGLSAKLRVREQGETRYRILTTNDTWRVHTIEDLGWNQLKFNDSNWPMAGVTGLSKSNLTSTGEQSASAQPLSAKPVSAKPVSAQLASAAKQAQPQTNTDDQRFTIDPEFKIEEVFTPDETGSLIALEFNEFGKLLMSREGGPLMIADLTQPVGTPDRIRIYCDQVNTCQGILPLNGSVYVTGKGPEGMGLYLLSDEKRTGKIDKVKKIVGFTGDLGEHGPHGIQLGPDGMLYVILGNGTEVQGSIAATSSYRHWYEGDLVPRYEDPGGHAVGVKAPGGTIIRLTLDGSKIERYAGGIRNAYDLVFDDQGELLVHDSDMESDVGAPWYRPNSLYHVPAGAELGWRSGWSNFPQHALDQTPALCGTGRGSPTGAVLYQHLHFPVRYHDTVFLADWSEGKILSVHKQPQGSGFQASTEVFLSGKPLNVCDLTVGEDGALYFCAGGRGTSGGVFRVVWTGTVPPEMLDFSSILAKVIRHPQPNSAWGRQNLALLSNQLGSTWGKSLSGVVQEARNPSKFRVRALQLLVLYGPAPSLELLEQLAKDPSAEIRAEAARICGINGSSEAESILGQLLSDAQPRVRRIAGEAYLRLEKTPNPDWLSKLLSSIDRHEALVGRRLLERIAVDQWKDKLLQTTETRLFINGALALMTAEPTLENAYQVLARCSQIFDGYINDLDFLDLLRVTELALSQGKVDPKKVLGLVDRVANEFPSGNPIVNQELIKIMAYLKIGEAEGRVEEYLKSEQVSVNDRIQAAMYLQFIGKDLPPASRLAIIDCLETHRTGELSAGLKLYLKRAIEDTAKSLDAAQVEKVIANGARWPNAVIPVFYQLPEKLNESTRRQVMTLDQSLAEKQDPVADQLRLGIIAILARSGDAESMEYLRDSWIHEPERRDDIVIGLAQQPAQENWPYLVSSLSVLDDLTGREIVQKLLKVERNPIEAAYFRDLILLGYRLRNAGALEASQLLKAWTGVEIADATTNWETQLDAWRAWYAQAFPHESPIAVGDQSRKGKHSVQGLVAYLEKNGLGDRHRGQLLFQSTQCAACHRQGVVGESIGPDLTSLAQRFSMREVLEATIDPSATIPDRYRSKVIITVDGDQHTGMAIQQANGEYLILRSDGQRIRVLKDDIEDIRDSNISAMPENLLDPLSVSEVADLMAFLMDAPDRTAKATDSDRLPDAATAR